MVQFRHAPAPGGEAPTGDDGGFTLVETLISLTILATLVILVVGGMMTLVVSSTLNRNQGAVASVVKRAAEDIRAAGYVRCDLFDAVAPYDGPYPFASFPASPGGVPENQASDDKTGTVVELPTLSRITTIDGTTVLWTRTGGRQAGCVGRESASQMVEIETVSADGNVTSRLLVAKAKPEFPS